MNKHFILLFALAMGFGLSATAQGPGGSTDTIPDGAAYILNDGSTVTLTGETLSTTQSDYNVVQVTNGNLTLNNCTITKSGDTNSSDGDATSFYGINSAVYAKGLNATSVITMNGGTITTNSKGSNAVFAWRGATIYVNDVTIHNYERVSRGLHATYEGVIVATNVDITTESETSSTIATDRGGGTVTVTGGSATAKGSKSAVIYSTGTMSATDLTGSSAQGEMAVIEGDNSITMTNCTMTSGSSERGLLMMQSGSGDASGYNPVMTITGTSLTMTDASAPLLEVATAVTATCTLDNCTVNVPSGILMYVMDDDQWTTNGAIGTLVLSNGTYSGRVKYDSGYTANVTINSDATWNLTANTSVCAIVNNGTINTNGYTLTYTSISGSGTINDGTRIEENFDETTVNDGKIYTLDGRCLGKTLPDNFRGIYIQNGKKHVKVD